MKEKMQVRAGLRLKFLLPVKQEPKIRADFK
jgi:hypothetical protein